MRQIFILYANDLICVAKLTSLIAILTLFLDNLFQKFVFTVSVFIKYLSFRYLRVNALVATVVVDLSKCHLALQMSLDKYLETILKTLDHSLCVLFVLILVDALLYGSFEDMVI